MTNSLFSLILGFLTVFMPFHCIEFDLIQDEDGIIHFDFVDELGVVKSLPLHKSESFLKAHFYDTQSQMLALVTLSREIQK